VPELVDRALTRAASSGEPAAVAAARLHLALVTIHPFRDGNGRTARLMASLLLAQKGFHSSLFTAVEQHFHPMPAAYVEVLDRFQYGEITEDTCVAHLIQAMVANAMYAAWFRARELRLRAGCAALGIPSSATNDALVAYDVDPAPSGFAVTLAKAVGDKDPPFFVLKQSLAVEHQADLFLQVGRLLDEEQRIGSDEH
jgi:prophage maintenance system killer protein